VLIGPSKRCNTHDLHITSLSMINLDSREDLSEIQYTYSTPQSVAPNYIARSVDAIPLNNRRLSMSINHHADLK
jgi:hypothetical protein